DCGLMDCGVIADLRDEGVDVACLQLGIEETAGEVAVVADRGAEGYVDVEPEQLLIADRRLLIAHVEMELPSIHHSISNPRSCVQSAIRNPQSAIRNPQSAMLRTLPALRAI